MLSADELDRRPFTVPVGLHLGVQPDSEGKYMVMLKENEPSLFTDPILVRWFSIPRSDEDIRRKCRKVNVEKLPYVRLARSKDGLLDALTGMKFVPLWIRVEQKATDIVWQGMQETFIPIVLAGERKALMSPLFLMIVSAQQGTDDLPSAARKYARKNGNIDVELLSRWIARDMVLCLDNQYGYLSCI